MNRYHAPHLKPATVNTTESIFEDSAGKENATFGPVAVSLLCSALVAGGWRGDTTAGPGAALRELWLAAAGPCCGSAPARLPLASLPTLAAAPWVKGVGADDQADVRASKV